MYSIDITRVMAHYGTPWDEMDDHTTLLEREIASRVPGGSPVDPDRQNLALDVECFERAELLRLGRKRRQAGVLEHVVEREQAAQEHCLRSVPAVADVLGAKRAVDPATEDPADLPALG